MLCVSFQLRLSKAQNLVISCLRALSIALPICAILKKMRFFRHTQENLFVPKLSPKQSRRSMLGQRQRAGIHARGSACNLALVQCSRLDKALTGWPVSSNLVWHSAVSVAIAVCDYCQTALCVYMLYALRRARFIS